jgi:hypothetical protein
VSLRLRCETVRDPARIVGKCHSRAAEDVEVRHDTSAGQTVAEASERLLDGVPVKERIPGAHATFNSCGAR